MKIDPDRLRTLRQQKRLSRSQLAERSGITERTIQRLENEPKRSRKTQENTLNSLAKALGVKEKPGVLTGDLPLPESNKAPADNLERVQIGAQITPKTRLAYDLIKRRYGVSLTEIINMAPLFFVLLAEGSLAWRREKLQKLEEVYQHLGKFDGFSHGGLGGVFAYMEEEIGTEQDSIAEDDLFGEQDTGTLIDPFDSSTDNPFARYLRKLANELDIPDVIDVNGGTLSFASNFKFPHYTICQDEVNHITNDSPDAKRTLETGCVRISEIPEELMAEDAGEERAKWLEDKLLDIYKKIDEELGDIIATGIAKDPSGKLQQDIEKTVLKNKEGGKDQ